MKRILTLVICVVMVLSVVGCSAPNGKNTAQPDRQTQSAEKAAELSVTAVEKSGQNILPEDFDYTAVNGYTAAVNKFAVEMAKKMGEETFIASPYSVYLSLLAILAGADGEAKEQLEKVLLPEGLTGEAAIEYMGSLIDELEASKQYKLDTNTLVAMDNKFTVDPDFAQKVVQYLKGETATIDFGDKNAYLTLNKWAEEKTKGLIKNLNSEPLPEETAMALLNSIYFLGQWKDEFDEKDTHEGVFRGKDKDSKAQFMTKKFEEANYIENGTYQAISLPYKGGAAMNIYLPKEGKSTDDVLKELEKKPDGMGYMEGLGKGTLTLPKFEAENTLELNDAVKALGLTAMFEGGLGRMMSVEPEKGLLSNMKQKAKITVDEKGTEAAAVTESDIVATALPPAPVEFEMNVNRPFVYTIVSQGMVLFMGISGEM